MMAHHRSRASGSSTSSNGSAYQLILDHILTYPGSYEIPLRTMYNLNCGPRKGSRPSTPTTSSSGSSPHSYQGSFQQEYPAPQQLTENLMSQLLQSSHQHPALPPSFITTFVQKCFDSDLTRVDFTQALTGLDYLKDLETRRRRDVAEAMNRLGIDRDTLDQDAPALSIQFPGLLPWVRSIEDKERKIENYYTHLFVGLRRWILINELSLLPFHKHNCVAMLNTLYPPAGISGQASPTTRLTPEVLKYQRDGFFKYIQAVERNGSRVLHNLLQQGKAPEDVNGWPAVARHLLLYLQLANSMISECGNIVDAQDIAPRPARDSAPSKHARKADSGISFTSASSSEPRPSTRGSDKDPASPTEIVRPKTPTSVRSGTALERLARSLRTLGRSRTDVTEMIRDNDATPPPFPPVGKTEKPGRPLLRKMRSMGSLGERKSSMCSLNSRLVSEAPAFDVAEMRKARAEYDARQKTGKRASNEV